MSRGLYSVIVGTGSNASNCSRSKNKSGKGVLIVKKVQLQQTYLHLF